MNAESTKISNDEAFQFLSLEIKASDTILRVAFKSYSVMKHGRKEGLQKYGNKPGSVSERCLTEKRNSYFSSQSKHFASVSRSNTRTTAGSWPSLLACPLSTSEVQTIIRSPRSSLPSS